MANEKRLIDANALMDEFRSYMAERYDREKCVSDENCKTCDRECLWRRIVNKAPTVDAVEVVHGRWVWDVETHGDPMYGIDEDFGYRCSKCGVWADEYGVDGDIYEEPPTHILHYCPNCGAKMDGDGNG